MLDCTDDFDHFLVRCDQADVYKNVNGLCYNYSSDAGKSAIGWWDREKRLAIRKPVLPSQDFFELVFFFRVASNYLSKNNSFILLKKH